MGAEVPGQLSVWLALAFNLVSGVSFVLVAAGKATFESLALRSYRIFTIFTVAATAYLFFLFFSHNYAFQYVYEYNERSQAFIYVLSGFWGGQAGTYLLWLLLSALAGFLILRRAGAHQATAMAVYAVINLFLLTLLVKLSPFALLPFAADDGLGLNPLLRDPWMVIHPPIIFVGYALCGVPFALAIAALARKDYDQWVTRAFPWVAGAALFLGAGNVLGGFWAYETLGWGGYWAWDPVENSSLVPWVISLSLLHGMIIEKRSGALRRTNLLMAAFLFVLVVYGTFLTRSGILADFSVHSFTDLGVNTNLVAFMALFTFGALLLFLVRALGIKAAPLNYNFFGREFSLFAAMVILFAFGVIVLFWSSLPIISGWFTSEPHAADIATYNSFALPLAVLMAVLLSVAPYGKYDDFKPSGGAANVVALCAVWLVVGVALFYFVLNTGLTFAVLFVLVLSALSIYLLKPDYRRALVPGLIAFVGTIAIALMLGVTDYTSLLFVATAATALVANALSLAGFVPHRWKLLGGPLTHFGFGVMLIGVLASSAYSTSERLTLARGETEPVTRYGVEIGYKGMLGNIETPENELLLSLKDRSGEQQVRPRLYFSERMQGLMRRPYIEREPLYDLYFAPQQVQGGEEDPGLTLAKGRIDTLGAFRFRFAGFEIGGHGMEGGDGITVSALIDVFHGADSVRVAPAVVHNQNASGEAHIESRPATFSGDDREHSINVIQILADQGMVVVSIPGLTGLALQETLVLEVSRKPLIALVWFGAVVILAGSLISLIRRHGELPRPPA